MLQAVAIALVDEQYDEGGEALCEAVPDVFPGGSGARLLVRREWGWGVDEQLARNELKPREGGGMPQDEVLCADVWLEYDLSQGERAEAGEVQPVEGQPRRGADRYDAVQGELCEDVLRWGEDQAAAEGAPEVQPAIKGHV